MKTINLEPDTAGLLRWLKHVYKTDQAYACMVLAAGWPSLSPVACVDVLTGKLELADALAAATSPEWGITR